MGDPQITYNSITIGLNAVGKSLSYIHKQSRNQNESASGKIETINIFGRFDYEFEAQFTQQKYFDLLAWWSWARQGKVWAFVLDDAKTTSQTLDGAAASGQKVIPIDATPPTLAVGDKCIIQAVDNDDEFEVIHVDQINAGVSVEALDNLKYSYTTGDTFRNKDYFPEVITTETNFRPTLSGITDKTSYYYKHTFRFTENL